MFSRGCEDDESGNGEQYGEFAIRMFILDETGDAKKSEMIFTKCTSCLEVTGKDNIEKTENASKTNCTKFLCNMKHIVIASMMKQALLVKNVYGGASSFNVVINTTNAMRRLQEAM